MEVCLDKLLKRLQSDSIEINKLVLRVTELQEQLKSIPKEQWYNIIGKVKGRRLYKLLAKFSNRLNKLVSEQDFLIKELAIGEILKEDVK